MLRIFFSRSNLGFAGVLMFFLFGLVPNVKAQQRQQIFQTSPEASALTKMVNYPINFNTGVPNIAIPLYEIQAGDLKLPIELSYHAGGFKIHEQVSC